MSAEIIPFPVLQAARPSAVVPGTAAEDRLQRALAALDAAVTGQRAAVAEWRRSLEHLGATMNGLGTSLGRYRDSLTHLEDQVGSLNGQALALEQWADKALTTEQG
jgi:ABC-type transporter Mla subunit MlaD